jgi:hypothetical protein
MRILVIVLFFTAVAGVAESAVISGRVLDRAGRRVSHARVRAFHAVPLIEYPPPGTWNGLLGEKYSDARDYFILRTSGRVSLDHLLVEGHGYFAVVSAPLPSTVRVVLNRKVLSPEESAQQLLKRLHRKTLNHAMERTPDRSASTFEMTSTFSPRATLALVGRRSSCSR